MRTRSIGWLAVLVFAAAGLLPGCASSERSDKSWSLCARAKPAGDDGDPEPATQAFLTGFVLQANANSDPVLIDLKGPVTPNGYPVPTEFGLRLSEDLRLHVTGNDGAKTRDFDVLCGPYGSESPVCGVKIVASPPTAYGLFGWVLVAGRLPRTESEMVSTTADGTAWILRIVFEQGKRVDYVYNVDSDETIIVKPKHSGPDPDGTPVPPGHYVAADDQQVRLPKKFVTESFHDDFVNYVKSHASTAGLALD